MDEFFTVYETASGGILPFGAVHLAWLLAGIVFLSAAAASYRQCGGSGRRRWRWLSGIAAAQILGELTKYAVVLCAGYPDVQYLPLHLCSVCMFASVGYAVRPTEQTGEFLFAVGLPGALAALLFPGWTALPPGSYLSVHSFLFHILLLASVLLPLSAGEIRPDVRRLPGCAGTMLFLLPMTAAVNRHFDTNFFFLTLPGAGNPLAFAAERWGIGGYTAALVLVCLLLWTVLYGTVFFLTKIYFDNRKISIDKI